ncbi:glycoside hydrolase family 3 C-terminal domain-containing protein [Thalassotalea ponticola]|uniref:beta-glucosidase n=1 Tax=Thalassotalea ponticola TaxID=1523392 RepID=UPI0025B34EDB|nr:glycoside hydrolase family 3 C-terminal domain-containing protein [Thalassotalea ponticola]MDN3651591.1 glycoside hydrolase family 3 C-terminal domain-containing protein [Thalassotalea ponticola]
MRVETNEYVETTIGKLGRRVYMKACSSALMFVLGLCIANSAKANDAQPLSNSAHYQIQQQRIADAEQFVSVLLNKLTLSEKISLVHASGKFHVNAIPRLGIPELWLSDGPHGVRYQHQRDSWQSAGWTDDASTYLPPLTSVAASFDPQIAYLHGRVLGAEARHRGKDIILGPGVNLARLPLYGRNFEYMGEDPFLAASLVVPVVQGIQSQDVAANVKHFALNNQELNRNAVNAKPDERTLREVYLPAFEAAVKQGDVFSVMGAYNQYYGTNANQSAHLVKQILKGEWGFDGVLLTDWNVDINTFDAAVNGLDLEMGTNVDSYDDYFFAKPLMKMINEGKIDEAILDDKVKRILRLMYRIGVWDDHRLPGERNTVEHQQAAKHIASSGVVLLKNDNSLLPLTKKIKNIVVMGPNADRKHALGGGSSEVKALYEITPLQGLKNYLDSDVKVQFMRAKSAELTPIAADYIVSKHWTGTPAWHVKYYQDESKQTVTKEDWQANSAYARDTDVAVSKVQMSATIKPFQSGTHTVNIKYRGNLAIYINDKLLFEQPTTTFTETSVDIDLDHSQSYNIVIEHDSQSDFVIGLDDPSDRFVDKNTYMQAAASADAVIYFGGLSHGDDREAFDRTSMSLPGEQNKVIDNLLQANPNTVVFMVAGSAVEMPWVERAKAIVWGWYAGMEAGNAYAELLFGDVNPSGKLPITLPVSLEDSPAIALDDYNAQETLYKEGVFMGHRWFEQQDITPLFWFGHGLSYSTFELSNMTIESGNYVSDDGTQGLYKINVDVTNTSNVAGSEVVQLYLQDHKASVPRPKKEFKGFQKVFLQGQETRSVSMILSKRDLSFWSIDDNDWRAEPGLFTVHLGVSANDIRTQKTLKYTAATTH